jgi:diguanylate cyclase (GGDEF)-like protein
MQLTGAYVAARTSVALVVAQDGGVRWLNDAARRLVSPFGGTWEGPCSALEELRGMRPGARWTSVRWPSPVGGDRWWQVACRLLGPGDPTLLYEITDETERHDQDLGDRAAQWRLSRLETLAGMGTWDWDPLDGSVHWSDGLLRLFGVPEGNGLDFEAFRAMVHPDDVPTVEAALAEGLRTGGTFTFTPRLELADGSGPRTFEFFGEVVVDAAGAPTRVLGAARDVTEQHRARQELAFLAEHDPLTGVANRRRFTARLAECAAEPHEAALLLIDVDNFKDINDLRGHAVGDHVMRSLAAALTARIGPDALLGRLGGDEFAVVVPGCDAVAGLALGEMLCDSVSRAPINDGGSPLRVSVSIGVACVTPDVESSLSHADLALYEAKRGGRNRARMFLPDQYDQAVRRVSLLQRVAAALDENTMTLDAQPIVDLRTGAITRHELLIRLRDGLEPVLGPADFLPAAERSDLVLHLDRWVLHRAIRALAAPRARATGLRLEVNMSARSLEDDELGGWILALLDEAGVEPQRLGLEITETAAVTSLDAARRLATQLIEAGCGFALDDFGSGFGSFTYLKHLRFTSVKIGGDFVRQLDDNRVDRALVTAVIGVCEQLGMTTVAEQVDRAELVVLLSTLGVDHGQGYHLGRPRPLTDLLSRAPRSASAT